MIAVFLTCQALNKNKNKNKYNVNPNRKSTELEVISDESGDENDDISYTTINFDDEDEENGKPNERRKLL